MIKVGDILKIKERAPYGITTEGCIVQVNYIHSLRDVEVILLEAVYKKYKTYEGQRFSLSTEFLEPYQVFQGPELPPVYLKIRNMYARQQAKGILRY